MAELEYSSDALNAKGAFYRVSTMVYVEGDDDQAFWEHVFRLTTALEVKVEAVGGSSELDKLIPQVVAGTLEAIVARDKDYLHLLGQCVQSCPRVLYTAGYSIENTLYCAEVIHSVTKAWCKSAGLSLKDCNDWLSSLMATLAPLLELDAASAVASAGVAVLGDNCTRFMKDQSSSRACGKKVAAKAKEVAPKLPSSAVASAKQWLAVDTSRPRDFLRGHFLASAIIKFIVQTAKALGKKVTVSADSLYAAAIGHFVGVFSVAHPHKAHYVSSTNSAAATFA